MEKELQEITLSLCEVVKKMSVWNEKYAQSACNDDTMAYKVEDKLNDALIAIVGLKGDITLKNLYDMMK